MESTPRLPIAPKVPKSIILHGETLVDEYAWLRERDQPEVRGYLEAENQYGRAVLAPLAHLEGRLYDEMLGRIKQTDLSVPYRDGDYWYYSRTEEGKQYPIYCRTLGAIDGPEQVILDLNELAVGHPYLGIGAFEVSPTGRYLAYSTDVTGYREYTLTVKELDTGAVPLAGVERVGSVAWAADERTIFYTVEDDAKRDYQLRRHRFGESESSLVFEETDETFRLHVADTRSRRYLLLYSASHLTTEVRLASAADPGEWRLVEPRVDEREYDIDHQGDRFLVRVNDTGPNFRVVAAPLDDPSRANWTEVLPHRDDVIIEGIECFAGHWAVWERLDGLLRIRLFDGTEEEHVVRFSEPTYELGHGTNAQYDTTTFRYRYESFVTPPSVYDYDLPSRESLLLKQREVLGGYDPSKYQSLRLTFRAGDGVPIAISLVRRADLAAEKPHPLHLTGYGAYGMPYPIAFNSNRFSLLDRGVIMAVAHVRGGGEFGRQWHDAGRMARKMNSFTDFIGAADHLVSRGFTTHGQLVIEGGSAGGLLIGAVINLRPEVCTAAVLHVPFVDVVNTMRDASLPLTVGEYEEWGNPNIEEHYRWIRSYCPYTNLSAKNLPSLLIRTSLNDSQVMYWEPAKYVARLRAFNVNDRPIIFLTNLDAGHAGASGRYDRLREIATDYAYILWRLGLATDAQGKIVAP